MYCKNCGREVDDYAVVCPHCGVQLSRIHNSSSSENSSLAIVGFVLSFFASVVGLIVSIIAYNKCKNENLGGKGFAQAGIIISAILIGLYILIIITVIGAASCAISNGYYY